MRAYSVEEVAACVAERRVARIWERIAAIEAELFELRDAVKAPHLSALRPAVEAFHSAAWDAAAEAEKVVKAHTQKRRDLAPCLSTSKRRKAA